jgi:prepilin-type N-terminal cleavage/methylation domain-containing protein
MKKSSNKGFSLIELIIAIAILVILTGLLAPQFMRYIEKSREAKDVQTLDTVYEAVQAALADKDAYEDAIDTTKHQDLSTASKGETLSSLLVASSADDFEKELQANLGGVSELKLESKKAKAISGGAIYVMIDDNAQVGVYYAGSAKGGSSEEKFNIGIAKKTSGESETTGTTAGTN